MSKALYNMYNKQLMIPFWLPLTKFITTIRDKDKIKEHCKALVYLDRTTQFQDDRPSSCTITWYQAAFS